MELTAVGRDFLLQARIIVSEVTRSIEALKDMSRHSHGSFTLACVPTMAAHMLPEFISKYAEVCPGNRIRLLDGTSYEVRNALLNNFAELGICIQGERNPRTRRISLFDDRLMFFCRDSHPYAKKASVTWSDMSQVELIVISNMTATRVAMDYQLAKGEFA